MLVKTILNRIEKQPGFVYCAVRLEETVWGPEIEVDILPRANGRARCSGCRRRRAGYRC